MNSTKCRRSAFFSTVSERHTLLCRGKAKPSVLGSPGPTKGQTLGLPGAHLGSDVGKIAVFPIGTLSVILQ